MKIKGIKSMAFIAILMPMLVACSGGSSNLFGSIPDEYEKFQAEKEKLNEEAKNIKSEADKAKLIEKSEKMQEEWSGKIEKSAKALDGKTIDFAESDIKVTDPVSLEFDGFFSKSDLTPEFKIKGSAEAAKEINTGSDYVLQSEKVYIVGYDADAKEVYKINVGSIPVEDIDGKAVVKAGTPVKFSSFHYYSKDTENYKAAKTIKLEVLR